MYKNTGSAKYLIKNEKIDRYKPLLIYFTCSSTRFSDWFE